MTLVCTDSRRRDEARAAGLNGIDFIEVVSPDQLTLDVTCLAPLPGEPGGPPGPPLDARNISIEGGVRVLGVQVLSVATNDATLTLTVDRAGDFSPYTLQLVAAPGITTPPVGFDPSLASRVFDFKAGCDSLFDCKPAEVNPGGTSSSPVIDYLARDAAGLVRLMRDRMSLTNPQWRATSAADPTIAVLEMLADVGDRLSYQQDAAGTEAYLRTARSRISLRRHARLLDHTVSDGANASAWVHVQVRPGGSLDGASIAAGTPIATGRGGPAGITRADLGDQLASGAIVFETKHALNAVAAHNTLAIHTWSDTECVLLTGATAVTLERAAGVNLTPGTPLALEEVRDPATGSEADADPTKRHIVVLTTIQESTDPVTGTDIVDVEWSVAEALPFDLAVSARPDAAAAPVATAVARANLVQADHGLTQGPAELGALLVPEETGRPWRPRLDIGDLGMFADEHGRTLPALALGDQNGLTTWQPLVDLLGSSADDPSFVVEFEHGHRPVLRFGDGRFGRRPAPGTRLELTARLGTGPQGNVGSDALSRLITDAPVADVLAVHNPLPATGGRTPETRDRILTDAPVTPLRQERAVTLADWIAVAELHPQVQRAHATLRWTGSWWTVFVAIDRLGGGSILDESGLHRELVEYLDRFRMTGSDIRVTDPTFIPLDIEIRLSVDAGYYRSDVLQAVREQLSPGPHGDGSVGLFHPNLLSFGADLPLSVVHARIDEVAGVRCADIVACHVLGQLPAGELEAQIVRAGEGQVLRLDDDPNFPENGRLRLDATGGV